MKIAIDSYCFHRYFGEVYDNQEKPDKTMTYEDFLTLCVKLKVDGVSLETCFFESTDESYLKKLKEIIDKGNLEVVVAWGHPNGLEGGKNPDALEDMKNTDRIVIGSNHQEVREKIAEAYKKLFPNAKYIFTDNKTAEMIKYAANVMLASQIALANEIYQICEKVGVDYNKVKDTILLDKRIGRNLDVPGPDGNFGFGGKCFPKDLDPTEYITYAERETPKIVKEKTSELLTPSEIKNLK